MKRFYVDGPFGQVHCLEWGSDGSLPPLICLSPSPFSSKAYLTLAPLLAQQRRVIAIDYPGFGNSQAKSQGGELSINDLAHVVQAVADACSPTVAVDLFGFHTGTLVAAEMSVEYPARVNRMVLADVPFFTPEKQTELLEKTPAIMPIDAEFSALEGTWQFCVTKKLEHIPLARAHQMFVDHISSGEGGNSVFRAAFSYSCESRFKQVTVPTWVLATKSGLYDFTCKTADTISTATLVELPHISAAVLDAGADEIANTVRDLLEK